MENNIDANIYGDFHVTRLVQLEAVAKVQETEWTFIHAGCEHFIPRIYHFEDTLLVDIVTLQNTEAAQKFTEEYMEQRSRFGWEHLGESSPLYWPFFELCEINGDLCQPVSSMCLTHIPDLDREDDMEAPALELLSTYLQKYGGFIHKDRSFSLTRIYIPYEKGPDTVHAMNITMRREEYLIPVFQEFDLENNNGTKKEVPFIHPETGTEHLLEIGILKEIDLQLPEMDLERQSENSKALEIVYQVLPELSQSERLLIKEVPQTNSEDGLFVIFASLDSSSAEEEAEAEPELTRLGFTGSPRFKNLEHFVTQPGSGFPNLVRCSLIGIYAERAPETRIFLGE